MQNNLKKLTPNLNFRDCIYCRIELTNKVNLILFLESLSKVSGINITSIILQVIISQEIALFQEVILRYNNIERNNITKINIAIQNNIAGRARVRVQTEPEPNPNP